MPYTMKRRTKIWKSLRTLGVAGASGLAACTAEGEGEKPSYADEATALTAGEGEGEGEAHEGEGHAAAEGEGHASGEGEGEAVAAESEDEGEGEGEAVAAEGEGEGEAAAEGEGEGEGPDLAKDDLAYLTQLGLMRGHLFVGHALFEAKHVDAAKTHMKHPQHELYAAMVPAFAARKTSGFAAELKALADAVEKSRPAAEVNAAYASVVKAIGASEGAVSSSSKTPESRLKLAAALVRVAAAEYAIGIVDGAPKNAHEYQDALGFTTVARQLAKGLPDGATKKGVLELLDGALGSMWPDLIPPAEVKTSAEQLYGVAARIDLMAARK